MPLEHANFNNTRHNEGCNFHHQEVGWTSEAQLSFLNQLWGVWKAGETLFQVFDLKMASQSINREI